MAFSSWTLCVLRHHLRVSIRSHFSRVRCPIKKREHPVTITPFPMWPGVLWSPSKQTKNDVFSCPMSLLATDASTGTWDQLVDVESTLSSVRFPCTGAPCHGSVAAVHPLFPTQLSWLFVSQHYLLNIGFFQIGVAFSGQGRKGSFHVSVSFLFLCRNTCFFCLWYIDCVGPACAVFLRISQKLISITLARLPHIAKWQADDIGNDSSFGTQRRTRSSTWWR